MKGQNEGAGTILTFISPVLRPPGHLQFDGLSQRAKEKQQNALDTLGGCTKCTGVGSGERQGHSYGLGAAEQGCHPTQTVVGSGI